MTIKPYSYQRVGIDFIKPLPASVLADDMGLGKTLQLLWGRKHDAVLVVCPASIKMNWESETVKFTDLVPHVCMGRGSFRWPQKGQVVICNPEIMPDWEPSPEHPISAFLDEAHVFRNTGSRKYRYVRAMLRRMKPQSQCVASTGTPLVNRLDDLANILDIIGLLDSHFGSRKEFAALMGGKCGKRGNLRHCEVNSLITGKLAQVMIRREKKDVLEDMPEKSYGVFRISEWSKKLQAVMDEGLNALSAFEALSGPIHGNLPPITELARARKNMAIAKTEHAIPMVDNMIDQGKQVVLYSAHRHPVETIGKRDGWACIHGGVSSKKRQIICEDFRRGLYSGIALTIGAGNCGLNLQSADQMVFMDLSYQLGENLQAEDRICRIGQQSDRCSYHYLTFDHPLDRRMGQILSSKKTLFDQVCDPITRSKSRRLQGRLFSGN